MKNLYIVISLIIYSLFAILFFNNIFNELDLFYVFWGAILIPLPLAYLYMYESNHNNLDYILTGSLVILLVLVVSSKLMQLKLDPGNISPMFFYLTGALGFVFFIVVLLSYVITLMNYQKMDKLQYLMFSSIILLFIYCRLVFLQSDILEHIGAILLFIALTTLYIYTFRKIYKSSKELY